MHVAVGFESVGHPGPQQGRRGQPNPSYSAAPGGYLGVLQWARENGCEWNRDACLEQATIQRLRRGFAAFPRTYSKGLVSHDRVSKCSIEYDTLCPLSGVSVS